MWPFSKTKKNSPESWYGEVIAAARSLLASPETEGPDREKILIQEAEMRSEELEREVSELYSEPDGTIPDLSRLEKARSHRVRNTLLGLTVFFALLAAAAWAGFFFFKPYQRFSPTDLTLKVEVPESVRSGERATVTVRYGAPGKLALAKMELALKLPKEFTLESAEPSATEGLRWVVGALPAGVSGEIKLTGVVRGISGALLTVQAFGSYVPVNFNSEFQNVASAALTIAGSTATLAATSTERVLPGEPVSVVFTYKNESQSELPAAAFRLTSPAGFVSNFSTPPPSEGSGFWKLGKLAAGAEGKVKVNGVFSSDAKGVEQFLGELGLWEGGSFALQSATSTAVSVIGGDLVVTVISNGAVEGAAVNFGDRIHATVSYANKSEAMIEDVALTMNLLGSPVGVKLLFNPATLVDSARGEFATTTLRWSKKEIAKLGKLAPGEEGSFDVSFKLVGAPTTPGVKDYSLDLWVEGEVGKVNGVVKNRKVSSVKFHFPFLSDLKLTAESRYYHDDEIVVGTGPLPPKVGQETTYRIFWTLENALHELQNLSLSAVLPENVRYTGKINVSAGSLAYDQDSRAVRWTLNKLPVGAPKTVIDFEVGLTPGAPAVGNILPLTGPASLDAEDLAVGAHLLRTAEAVDTALVGDPLGRGKGVVGQ